MKAHVDGKCLKTTFWEAAIEEGKATLQKVMEALGADRRLFSAGFSHLFVSDGLCLAFNKVKFSG